MKYIFALLLVNLSWVLVAQGRFGIAGGPQVTGLHSKDHFSNFPDPRIGFRIGGFYEQSIRENFGIRTELSYSLAGGKGIDNRLDVSYLSVPVLFYYYALKQVQLHLGPELNVFIANSATRNFYNSKDFKPFDFGISVGSEVRITEHVGISLRNYFGLIHASEIDTGKYRFIQPDDPIINPDRRTIKYNRNNIFQLGVSYYFSKKSF